MVCRCGATAPQYQHAWLPCMSRSPAPGVIHRRLPRVEEVLREGGTFRDCVSEYAESASLFLFVAPGARRTPPIIIRTTVAATTWHASAESHARRTMARIFPSPAGRGLASEASRVRRARRLIFARTPSPI